jgi:hypothetical protein
MAEVLDFPPELPKMPDSNKISHAYSYVPLNHL